MKLYRNLSEAVVQNLHDIFEGNRYADKVIEKVLKQHPKWGARDRRFIAETTYDIVRWYRLFRELSGAQEGDYWSLLATWCIWNTVDLPPWDEFKAIQPRSIEENYDRAKSNRKIRESIPDWLDSLGETELTAWWDKEVHALNEEAKVVLRVNTLKITREGLRELLLEEEGIETERLTDCPDALLLHERQNIFTRQAFKDGLFEVQDAASQRIAPYLDVKPGMRVIDACAGAGGKTLHLAALMQNKGRIIAMDTEAWKLDELKKRARRAGASDLIEARLIDSSKVIKRLEGTADRVLLDVPCSGLGVLRRNPDSKWKLSLEFIEKVQVLQQEILQQYSVMLKPGGMMVYATCSILPSENEKQVEKFLATHGDKFEMLSQDRCWPSEGYDGFFMAKIRRRS